jgi:hypothetical protein
VLNRASAALRRQLAAHGFSAVEVDVGEFLKAGGAVKCLCLRLDEAPLRTATPGSAPGSGSAATSPS